MKLLWLLVVLQTTLAQPGFGRSYLRNSRLCHQWSCLNSKLGLSDSLPTPAEFGAVLNQSLPAEWRHVVDSVLQTCYNDRKRRYTNTCPGQAIMHCAVDQLIANCPNSSLRQDDACAPIYSLAGFNYMFTQSIYENIERNIAVERRPAWFLRNYFNSKCCNLPVLFNSTTLSECGFTSMIQYRVHNPEFERKVVLPSQRRDTPIPSTPENDNNSIHVVSLKNIQIAEGQPIDPLDCCDISDFIQPAWRQECNFQLNWEAQSRLVVKNTAPVMTTAAPITTSTASPVTRRDITIVPQSCDKSTCVFNKLNILTPSGTVDMEAFTRLLDNLTTSQPSWSSAKARVVTTCLRKPMDYQGQCEINNILACAFDVLTENCPSAKKNDSCKSRHTGGTEKICQISSSKYRPKHRREICILPDLVERKVLIECGLTSLSKVEPVTTVMKPKTYRLFTSAYKCQDLTPSTSCLMSKMGILNKYGFMDYFKMKDTIRHFGLYHEWSALENVYLSAFNNGPLYIEHCNSAKKLLNVIDSILMTCPESKRKNTEQCTRILDQITNTPADRNLTEQYTQQILKHFHHVFFPTANTPKVISKHTKKIKKAPIYNYGILNGKDAPKVVTIDVKPTEKPAAPLVLLPVYMRVPNSNLLIRRPFNNDGIWRSSINSNPITRAQRLPSHTVSVSVTSSSLLQPISSNLTSTTQSITTVFTTPSTSSKLNSTVSTTYSPPAKDY